MHHDFLHRRLRHLSEAGTLRRLPGPREGIDFWSNDYLGFGRLLPHSDLSGGGSSGSRLISGDSEALRRLEERIAAFHGMPAALLFGSGYTANLGLLSCLARRTDTIIYDELIHASLRDGIRLSGAAARRCKHNSIGEVDRQIQRGRVDGEIFVVTESRFSMDGDVAPLKALADHCPRAHLIIDEAHSFGLEGKYGRGMVAELGLQDRVFAVIVTYGKAGGYHGAAVLGSPTLREYLINFCRPLIYTTAPPPGQVATIEAVYDLLERDQPTAYERLRAVIGHFNDAVDRLGLRPRVAPCHGPIQTVRLAGNAEVMQAEKMLYDRGMLVKGIRSPTIAAGTERLRICLHSFNTEFEVEGLLATIDRLATFAPKF